MCEEKGPDIKAFARNMRVSMPFFRKLRLIVRNNALKLFSMSTCCGHSGEPGC